MRLNCNAFGERRNAHNLSDRRLQWRRQTTFAKEFLPTELKCLRFLNPDEIAWGLSPLDPSRELFAAGRVLLDQFRHFAARGESFTVESALSGRTYSTCCGKHCQWATNWRFIISCFPMRNSRSVGSKRAWPWEDTMSRSRQFEDERFGIEPVIAPFRKKEEMPKGVVK